MGVTDSTRTNEREERGNDFIFKMSRTELIHRVYIMTNDSDWLNYVTNENRFLKLFTVTVANKYLLTCFWLNNDLRYNDVKPLTMGHLSQSSKMLT